jgi:hypothetical protein
VVKAYYAEADEPAYKPAANASAQTVSVQTAPPPPAPSVAPVFAAPSAEVSFLEPPAERNVGLDRLAIDSLSEVVREIIGIVARDSTISAREREELMLVCEGFEQAVTIGAEKAIRTMYIGLKYTLQCSPLARP